MLADRVPTGCGAGSVECARIGGPVLLAPDVAPAAGTGGDAVEHHAQEHRAGHGGDGPPDLG